MAVPVFVELYGEPAHLLHGAVGEGELHEGLAGLPAEGSGDLQSLTLLRRQPDLQHSAAQPSVCRLKYMTPRFIVNFTIYIVSVLFLQYLPLGAGRMMRLSRLRHRRSLQAPRWCWCRLPRTDLRQLWVLPLGPPSLLRVESPALHPAGPSLRSEKQTPSLRQLLKQLFIKDHGCSTSCLSFCFVCVCVCVCVCVLGGGGGRISISSRTRIGSRLFICVFY